MCSRNQGVVASKKLVKIGSRWFCASTIYRDQNISDAEINREGHRHPTTYEHQQRGRPLPSSNARNIGKRIRILEIPIYCISANGENQKQDIRNEKLHLCVIYAVAFSVLSGVTNFPNFPAQFSDVTV